MQKDLATGDIVITSCSPKKLAAIYGISTKVLRRWLCSHGSLHQTKNRMYNIEQLLEIIKIIGLPF